MNVIKRIQTILAIVLLTFASITCTDIPNVKDSIEIVQLTAEMKIPILRIAVDKKEYTFLIDLKSPVSFIDSSVVVKRQLQIIKVDPSSLRLVTGDVSNRTKAVSIMSNTFYVHNFKTTKANVKWHTGISIDGIIGKDMIDNNKASIDLKQIILDKLNKEN